MFQDQFQLCKEGTCVKIVIAQMIIQVWLAHLEILPILYSGAAISSRKVRKTRPLMMTR